MLTNITESCDLAIDLSEYGLTLIRTDKERVVGGADWATGASSNSFHSRGKVPFLRHGIFDIISDEVVVKSAKGAKA